MPELPVCKHCYKSWTYTDTLKNLLRLRCPYCRKENFFSRKFRWREPLFFIFVMIMNFFIFPFLSIPFLYKTCIFLVILMAYILTLPFGLELAEKEEPYF